jgi:lysophospholipase L1-like esterase
MKILPYLLLLGFTIVSASADSPPTTAPTPIRVACIGDSITEGYGADPGKSYPSQLQPLLGNGYQVKNFGLGGRTLLKNGDAPYWREQALKDAQAFQPNIVVIMLGTNDTKPQNWVHHDEFASDYKELIELFKNLDSKPHVFICRPCPVPDPGNYGINEANLQTEIPLIDKLATDENVSLIDMHAALAGKPELLPDHVHPNTAGAGIMAQTVADAITGKGTKGP